MTYRVIDVETTGLPSDNRDGEPTGMMEIAWSDLTIEGVIKPPVSMLVDSGIPVSIGARAVHHISDEMVAGEVNPSEACGLAAQGEHIFVCAHNVDHEKNYVGPGVAPGTDIERKWLCSYKAALRLWPEAPGHKLQELRYFLKIDDAEDFDPKLAMPPHRAGADSYVCAHVLRKVLAEAKAQNIDHDRLIKWSTGPALLYICFLKKYKGTPWKDVDKGYLDWIVNKSDISDRDIRATAKYYLTR
jgi:exodeoxyribonuclease X